MNKGVPGKAQKSYLHTIRKWVPDEPVVHIDDSDIVKPDGRKFESLGLVRDGSKSTDTKNVYEKGYHVTEACALTKNGHPVSIFSKVHSSKEKDFTSINDVTFSAMERAASLFGKATFVMDRGYDDNKMFLKLHGLEQDYVIRLTARRKLIFHGKWIPATQLREQRKGKIKMPLYYKGKKHDAYLSHVKVPVIFCNLFRHHICSNLNQRNHTVLDEFEKTLEDLKTDYGFQEGHLPCPGLRHHGASHDAGYK